MADDIILYGTEELLPMIEALVTPGNFLLRTFFPEVIEFDSADVRFDRLAADRRLAPFVSPLAPGKIQQPKGFQTETLAPAYVKPKNQITGAEVLKRLPGERLMGELSAADRRARIMFNYLLAQRTKIDRRLEWMASSVLRTSQIVIAGDDYPAVVVDFARDASLTKVLAGGARWGQAGVSPVDDVDEWINEVGNISGASAGLVIMDRLAWQLYSADPKLDRVLSRVLGQTVAMNLGMTPATPGAPVYKGSIGNVEFYVYNDLYEDDAGATQQLLPDYTVIVGSQGGLEGAQMFGAILDPKNNYGPARYFPKNWFGDDPPGDFVMTQSAPVLGPRRINATLSATVN